MTPIPIFIIAQVLAMIVITVANIVTTQGRTTHTQNRESRRLRIALCAELRELAWLYDRNLTSLREGQSYLLSSRACTPVYRANLGRLVAMPDDAIQELVHAYAVSEQVEHLVAATTKPNGGLAFRTVAGETPVGELIMQIERASYAIQSAVVGLERKLPRITSAAPETAREAVRAPRPAETDGIHVRMAA